MSHAKSIRFCADSSLMPALCSEVSASWIRFLAFWSVNDLAPVSLAISVNSDISEGSNSRFMYISPARLSSVGLSVLLKR